MSISQLILVDGNASWVRSLTQAVAATGVEVLALRPYPVSVAIRSPGVARGLGRWSPAVDGYRQRSLLLPGWRLPRLSTMLLARSVRHAMRRFGQADAILYTLPQYAGVAEQIRGPRAAYYAHDVFRFYDWNPREIIALEKRMLDRCDVVFSVAEALTEDFRRLTQTPLVTLRMAASQSFVDRLRQSSPLPHDLAALPRPIIGCTGQINRTYDWDLIAALAHQLPEASFVFIGPVFHEPDAIRRRIQAVLTMPNVRWLGPKPHEQLPAYLNAFDICFNPLLVNEHNDRRSPLRLYDYLATTHPVISTPVREAFAHGALLETFKTADQGATIIRRIISGQDHVDIAARGEYMRQNTWPARAEELLRELNKISP
jgi:hypothetical protein